MVIYCWIAKKIKNYVGNKDISRELESSRFLFDDMPREFPIYGYQIINWVQKAITRRMFFDKASESLSDKLPILNPTHLIIKDILDCMCNTDDLALISDDENIDCHFD